MRDRRNSLIWVIASAIAICAIVPTTASAKPTSEESEVAALKKICADKGVGLLRLHAANQSFSSVLTSSNSFIDVNLENEGDVVNLFDSHPELSSQSAKDEVLGIARAVGAQAVKYRIDHQWALAFAFNRFALIAACKFDDVTGLYMVGYNAWIVRENIKHDSQELLPVAEYFRDARDKDAQEGKFWRESILKSVQSLGSIVLSRSKTKLHLSDSSTKNSFNKLRTLYLLSDLAQDRDSRSESLAQLIDVAKQVDRPDAAMAAIAEEIAVTELVDMISDDSDAGPEHKPEKITRFPELWKEYCNLRQKKEFLKGKELTVVDPVV